MFFLFFLANIAGASPSSAKFINTLVTANNEPTNVEKPAKINTTFKINGTYGKL
ncbi:Uncharacterised protein [Streptococcus pneumoniae]|nr:Uncharacterised protein [Streptococcus pneumoniae]CRG02175.1 Uncharacterised protein [Streptococcus pneumoniae]